MEVNHIGIRVRDLAVSRQFYQDALGAEPLQDVQLGTTQLAFFRCGTTTIELIAKPEYEFVPNGVIEHIAFSVDDLDAEIARLKKWGVTFLMPAPIPFRDGRIIFFAGPDGERLELCQR